MGTDLEARPALKRGTTPERRRRRGRREIDQGFPPFQDSTTPSSARSDGPATKSGEEATARGRGREEEKSPAAAARPRRSHATHAAGRDDQHLRAPSTGEIDTAISTQGRRPGFQSSSRRREAADPRRHLHRKTRGSRQAPRVAAGRGQEGGEEAAARVWGRSRVAREGRRESRGEHLG